MLFEGGLEEVEAATGARVGDKTLMDALIPATVAFSKTAGAASMAAIWAALAAI